MGFVDFWPFGSIFNRFGLTVNALVTVIRNVRRTTQRLKEGRREEALGGVEK